MYLWRRFAGRQWLTENEEKLRTIAGDGLVIIERLNRKRLQLEIASTRRAELENIPKQFGGKIEKLPRDWLKGSLRHKTKPLKVGTSHLTIPAGAAFGTGEHATTAMSLRLLEKLTRNWNSGWSTVDLGTGSGILALAAKLLGADRAIGIDDDPTAITTAKHNAWLNKVRDVTFRVADVRRWKLPAGVDIATANLFSELLIQILPKLRSARWLVLSGVLRLQERDLRRGLTRNKIELVEVRRRGKWVAILARSR
jgi:ribosomal protein L11 methyltransferase